MAVLLGVAACSGSDSDSLDGGLTASTDGNSASSADSGPAVAPDSGTDAGDDVAVPSFRFAPEIVATGCAKALACANLTAGYSHGLGHCVADLARIGAADLREQTMLLSFNDDGDWLLELALVQNMGCVQAASDCTAIAACLNQGQAQAACIPPGGYAGKRRCSDGTHLRGCTFVDSSRSSGGVEATVDCAAWGLACVETALPETGKTFASCAIPVASPRPATEPVTVTCQGDLARFEFGSGAYTFACDALGATCAPGDYPLETDDFCVGKRAAACTPASFTRRCEGDTLIECRGGVEAAQDCSAWGATCGTPTNSSAARCAFACDGSAETCVSGAVSYCGPNGMTSLACASVGMTTCILRAGEPTEAWCMF